MNKIQTKQKIIEELKNKEFPDLKFIFSKGSLQNSLEILEELLKKEKKDFKKLLKTPNNKINFNTFKKTPASKLEINDLGVITIKTDRPIPFEKYENCRGAGGVILINRSTKQTVAAGMINFALRRAKNLFTHKLDVDKNQLKSALQRMSILSNEQFKGVKLTLSSSEVRLSTNNPSQEEGEDSISCTYSGENLDIGFNLTYLIEVIDVISSENIVLQLNNSDSGCLISSQDNDALNKYIIMPMRV